MNYKTTTFKAFASAAAFLAIALVISVGAAPAHAQYYGNGYRSAYNNPTYRNASVVYPNGYYYSGTPPYSQSQPITYVQPQTTYVQPVTYIQPSTTYIQPTYQYSGLSASCYAETSSITTGTSVNWEASAFGGSGSYSYSWYGTDGFDSYGASPYMTYYNPGVKTASVTVYSGGQSVTVNCNNSVSVYGSYAYQPTTYVQPVTYVQPTVAYAQTSDGLDIGCYSDPSTAVANQPVTWTAEVTGGAAPYTYTWTGSDGLSGTGSSVTMYYATGGSKSAVVTVTSANGITSTHACSDSLAVRSAAPQYAYAHPTIQQSAPQPQVVQQNTSLPAASAFSLAGIPWGWVAVLIILVLFATVMYLVFNRPKI